MNEGLLENSADEPLFVISEQDSIEMQAMFATMYI